jgi:predicted amidohydrolase YtcJ
MGTIKNNLAKKIDRREFLKISGLTTVGILTGLPSIEASTPTADLVLTNGKIITVDSKDSIAEAVVVKHGKILEVGSKERALQYVGSGTKIVDLKGKAATPGLIDSHAHLPVFGQRENGWFVKLHGLQSKEEIMEALAQRARKTPKGEWISAWGVEDLSLSYLDKDDLDRVTKEHPMLVVHTTGQWGFVNSLALKVAGIGRDMMAPPGSKVEMNLFKKEPTGVLIHYPALDLARRNMPVPDDEQAKDALLFAANLYAAEGVTTVHDNFFMLGAPYFQKAYFELVHSGRMPVRIKIWPYFANFEVASRVFKALFESDELQPASRIQELIRYKRESPGLFASIWGGFKIAVDGIPLWHANPQGFPMHKIEELLAMMKLFHRADHQVAIHASGDRAVDLILDAIEACLKDYPRQDHRHRIEHAICPQPNSLERIKKLGVVVSTHPQFIFAWGDKWGGLKNRKGVIPLKSYLKRGIPVAIGADPPAFPIYQPQVALWEAGARITKNGYRFESAESISIQEALRIQTMGSAYSGFQEKEIGSIEKGKLADMVVWNHDFYTIPKDEIKDVKAVLTIVGGKIVHEKNES